MKTATDRDRERETGTGEEEKMLGPQIEVNNGNCSSRAPFMARQTCSE